MTEPTFPVSVVVAQTGLKAVTLRAWERRYGLPDPARSETGQRLYQQRDIDTVNWLLARQKEGMSISRAVALWQSLAENMESPLSEATPYPSEHGEMPASRTTSTAPAIDQLRQAWLSACLAFDEESAEYLLGQAFSRLPAKIVCLELLQKGMVELGRRWFAGSVTIQQEHFTSALVMRRLSLLVAAAPPPTQPQRILVGCAPGDHHTFSPLLIALLLRWQGWDVVYLGANVPVAIERTIAQVSPRLVVMCAQQMQSAADLMEMAQRLPPGQTVLAYGGRVFNTYPALCRRIAGHFLGQHLADVPQAVRKLLAQAQAHPAILPPSPTDADSLIQYRSRRGAIESSIWEIMLAGNKATDRLPEINTKMAQVIVAALRLGALPLLDISSSWLSDLWINHHLPHPYLRDYLAAYHQAAQQNLGQAAAPVTTWLGRLVDNGKAP